LRDTVLARRKRPAVGLEPSLDAALNVEVPFPPPRLKAESLHRDRDLHAPARVGPYGGRLPDSIPVGVIVFATRVDQTVIARATGVDGEDVPGPAIEEGADDDSYVIFRGQRRVAANAEADDFRRIRVVTDDADREGFCVCQYSNHRAGGRWRTLDGIGLDEGINRFRRGP
jgi:hypothetical protein